MRWWFDRNLSMMYKREVYRVREDCLTARNCDGTCQQRLEEEGKMILPDVARNNTSCKFIARSAAVLE